MEQDWVRWISSQTTDNKWEKGDRLPAEEFNAVAHVFNPQEQGITGFSYTSSRWITHLVAALIQLVKINTSLPTQKWV